jgi:MFS family permease
MASSVVAVVGFLAFVEFTSGIIQGYYTPLYTDVARFLNIHDADVNWLEGTQLMLSAIAVPIFAKLGDMVGHKRMLLIATGITAVAAVALTFSTTFAVYLTCWTLMGCYVAWLPLEIALVWSRSRGSANPAAVTRLAAGVLVAALEIGAITGALIAGALATSGWSIPALLWLPAGAIVICFFVILFGVGETPDLNGGVFDTSGAALLALALLALTGGLSLLRILGPGNVLSWVAVVVGLALMLPFIRHESRATDPLIDVRMFRNPALWPVFATAGLFGVSVLGAQTPLSTFARTDPTEVGYGLGATASQTSLLIGGYVISLVVGALLFPVVTKWVRPRIALIGASCLVGIGYLAFLPFHHTMGQVVANMIVAGIGSGALVAALPATAAAAAPSNQTGVATGLTNAVKTVGGAVASCVFGIALLRSLTDQPASHTAGSFSGYVTVWVMCGVTALLAAVLLLFVPKTAFADKAKGVEGEVGTVVEDAEAVPESQ